VVLKKNHAVMLLLILTVILILANFFYTYYDNQLPTIPDSTSFPAPRQTIEPTLPPSQPPPSQQEPSESSDNSDKPTSPIIITPSVPEPSTQPGPNLKISAYSLNPLTNQLQPLTGIDWSDEGPLLPGQSKNSSRVYFKNEGNVPVTLYQSTSGWSFEDYAGKVLAQNYNQYFSLGWDYDNATVAVNETKPVTFTLTISPAVVDVARFSFGIVVNLTY
jgi:hypothetical protein